jgi:hypothetical protein
VVLILQNLKITSYLLKYSLYEMPNPEPVKVFKTFMGIVGGFRK